MTATKNIGSVTMPPGEYFVGDPCYAVREADWMPWLEAADYINESTYLLADVQGRPVLGIGTANGDGTYRGSDGNVYGVDAGMIGVVPVEVAQSGCKSPRVTFDVPFDCTYDDGEIRIGRIVIDTNDIGLEAEHDDDDDDE